LVRNGLFSSGSGGANVAEPLEAFDVNPESQEEDKKDYGDETNNAGDDDDYLGIGVLGWEVGLARVEWWVWWDDEHGDG
jgi:hypothetical protein